MHSRSEQCFYYKNYTSFVKKVSNRQISIITASKTSKQKISDNDMTPKFPCGVCYKPVAKNHNAACCDSCNLWVHINCNNLTKFCYRKF